MGESSPEVSSVFDLQLCIPVRKSELRRCCTTVTSMAWVLIRIAKYGRKDILRGVSHAEPWQFARSLVCRFHTKINKRSSYDVSLISVGLYICNFASSNLSLKITVDEVNVI